MKTRSLVSLIAAFAIVAPVVLSQQESAKDTPNMMQRGEQRLTEKLNLSDQQKKEIDQLRFNMAKQAVTQQAKVKTARLELTELFKADSPDKAAIEKKVGEIAQLESQTRLLFVDHWFSVNKLLNADQQKIWKQMLGHAWMQERFGRMGAMAPRSELRGHPRRF